MDLIARILSRVAPEKPSDFEALEKQLAEADAQRRQTIAQLTGNGTDAGAAQDLAPGGAVRVEPGGRTFDTISAALESITDNSLRRQYVVEIGPGTYREVVHCKPYVYLKGAGVDATIVTADAAKDWWDSGTIRGCSHSAVQDMTIEAAGAKRYHNELVGVDVTGAQGFSIDNCRIRVRAEANDTKNLVGVAVNEHGQGVPPPSAVRISYSILETHERWAAALVNAVGSLCEVANSKIYNLAGGDRPHAVISASGAKTTLYGCDVSTDGWAIQCEVGGTCIATNCDIRGINQGGEIR